MRRRSWRILDVEAHDGDGLLPDLNATVLRHTHLCTAVDMTESPLGNGKWVSWKCAVVLIMSTKMRPGRSSEVACALSPFIRVRLYIETDEPPLRDLIRTPSRLQEDDPCAIISHHVPYD